MRSTWAPGARGWSRWLDLFGVGAAAALATRQGMLPIVLAVVLAGITTIVGFRWPLLPLLLFAALIPLEGVVVIEGFGTVTRLVGILFAVTYGAPRLGRLALGAMPPAAWAYLAWAILSLGWAIDPDTALAQLHDAAPALPHRGPCGRLRGSTAGDRTTRPLDLQPFRGSNRRDRRSVLPRAGPCHNARGGHPETRTRRSMPRSLCPPSSSACTRC